MKQLTRGVAAPRRTSPILHAIAILCAAAATAAAATANAQSADNAATTLPAVSVSAARDAGTEGSGSYTTGVMSTATRLNLSVRDTPQSVSVVTRQQMDDQNMQSIEDVANLTLGLTMNKGATERASFYSRGFAINYFTQDGLPIASDADTLGFATLAMYDRIEVLRGAAGMLTGIGNPAGVLNLVRKRPTQDTQVSATAGIGRWNNYRAELDAGGALNDAKTLRGRAVLAYQDSDTYIANYSHQRSLLYATAEADLGRDTTLSVGFHYSNEKNPGSTWYGLPAAADGNFLPLDRSANSAPDWAFWNKKNSRVFAELEHRLDNAWKLKLAAQVLKDELDSRLTGFARIGKTNTFNMTSANIFIYDRTQHTFDVQATGPFSLLGGRHEVVFGVSHRTRDIDDLGYNVPGYTYQFDPVNWDTSAEPNLPITNLYYGTGSQTRQTGAYATARFKLGQPLALLIGGRVDKYDYSAMSPLTGKTTSAYKIDKEITPYAGLVYDLNGSYSLYGSWTSVFNPQSAVDQNGSLLDPVTGTNMEAGIKGEFFGGMLNASAAVFDIKQKNLALALPATACKVSLSCSEAAGEVESKGYELEIAGALTPDWQLSGGYTYNKAEYTRDSSSGKAGARYASERPNKLFKVSTSYKLPGALRDWRVGGSLRAQNAIYKTSNPLRQGGYAIVDLTAGWKVNRQLDLRLSVSNLFDKSYYQTIGTIDASNAFGEPRNIMLTGKYTF